MLQFDGSPCARPSCDGTRPMTKSAPIFKMATATGFGEIPLRSLLPTGTAIASSGCVLGLVHPTVPRERERSWGERCLHMR
jgi:hypothetical protein